MDEIESNTELLLEESILSEPEKREILDTVDSEFSRIFGTYDREIAQDEIFKEKPILPLLGVAIILFAAALILVYLHNFSIHGEEFKRDSIEYVSDSEWKVLQYYMEQSENAINEKDLEIQTYREKVADYDQKLAVLRQLIVSKREIERFLLESEERLKARGLTQEQIEKELEKLEEEQVSGLAPEVIRQYGLNLDEINEEIDKVLDEKDNNEQLLQQRIDERNKLISENQEMANTIEQERELREDSAKKDAFNQFLLKEYKEILSLLQQERFNESLSLIKQLRSSLTDSGSTFFGDIDPGVLVDEQNYLGLLYDYTEHKLSELSVNSEPESTTALESELTRLADSYGSAPDNGNKTAAANALREYVQSIPALGNAFAILEEDSVSGSVQEDNETTKKPREPLLLGKINSIQFNQIEIESAGSEKVTIEKGMVFNIYRMQNGQEMLKLGQGEIIQASPLRGRILSLSSTKHAPEIDDSVYLMQPEEQ